MRRLRAPDKSGASEPSAVLMEERETEEVGGEAARKIQPPSAPSPCHRVWGKKLPLLLQLPSLPPTSLGPGEGFPRPRDNAGKGAGIPLCGGDSMGEG